MTILNKLNQTVSIVHYTYTKTGRTASSTDADVAAFVTKRKRLIRKPSGNEVVFEEVVFLKGTQTINKGDEIIVGSDQRALSELLKPKRPRSTAIHHIEAVLA